MTVQLIPDIERVVGDALRNHPDIEALEARVAGQLPKAFVKPWIRVTMLDATNVAPQPVEHLINYLVQLDCYAGAEEQGAQAEASTLARTARAVLGGLQGAMIHNAGVIGQVRIRSHARIPDMEFSPPRECHIIDAEIYCHAQ